MAFENISKGIFYNAGKVVRITGNYCSHSRVYSEEDAEFISYCFNLQQRYDISKLEEAVVILNGIHLNGGVGIGRLKQIEQLLKEIKK